MVTKKFSASLASLLVIFTFASFSLSACIPSWFSAPPIANVTPTSVSPSPTSPPFPSLGTQGPGWHVVFRQENHLPANTSAPFSLGDIVGNKATFITFACQGTGKGSIQLIVGSGNSQIKNDPTLCTKNAQPVSENIDASILSSLVTYHVQVIIVGQAHWEVLVEQQD